jgi:hypothetical protein
MKKYLLSYFAVIFPAIAQLPFVVTTPTELSSLCRYNSDALLDLVVLDRASGALRIGLQNGDGTLSWQTTQYSGVANATAMAVGTLAVGGLDAFAVANQQWNEISYVNQNGLLSPMQGAGIAHTALAPGGTGQSLVTPLVCATNLNTQTPVIGSWQWSSGALIAAKNASILTSGNAITLDNGQRGAIFQDLAANELQLWKYYGGSTGIKKETFLTGLPAQAQVIAAAFTNTRVDEQILFHATASNTFHCALSQSIPSGYSISPPLAVATPFAIGALRAISHATGAWLLIISTDGIIAELMNFNPVTGSLTARQTFTASSGRSFQTATSAGNGHFYLIEGTNGRSSHWQRAQFNGANHTITSSGALPTLASSPAMAGTPNLYTFDKEPWVNAGASPTRYFRVGDWTLAATLGSMGVLQVNILNDGGNTIGLGNPNTLTQAGANPADTVVPAQVRSDVALGTIGGNVGSPRDTIILSPPPGNYIAPEAPVPAVSPNPFALGVRLAYPNTFNAYYRLSTTGPWIPYDSSTFPGLESTTTIQAFAINTVTGAATPIISGTYTFLNSPPPLAPANFLDTDNNGLSDAWEKTFAQDDPLADPDSDGLNNLQEQALGSDPLNSQNPNTSELPALAITLLQNPARIVLTWTSDEIHILEKSFDMNNNWVSINSGTTHHGALHQCTIPLLGEPAKQFFRLRNQ